MRKICILLILSIFFFSGCIPVNIENNLFLNSSGGGKYINKIYISKQNALAVNLTEEMAHKETGDKLPSYANFTYREDKEMITMAIKFSFNDIEDYNSKLQKINQTQCRAMFTKNSSFLKTSYYYSEPVTINAGGAIPNSCTIYVTMPGSIKGSNGNVTKDGRVRFDLSPYGDNNIWARSEGFNLLPIFILILIIGIGLAVFIFISGGIGVFVIVKKKDSIKALVSKVKEEISTSDKEEKCKKCGTKLKINAKFCEQCGQTFTAKSLPDKKEKNLCPECKAKLKKGEVFCEQCGYNITSETTLAVKKKQSSNCSSCGSKLKPKARFCEECGETVKE